MRKTRRLAILLEVDTNVLLSDLRKASWWQSVIDLARKVTPDAATDVRVVQATPNVVSSPKAKRGR